MKIKQAAIGVFLLIFAFSCKNSMSEQYTNHLAGESSLYLQQHAHNPVDWYPWSDEAWERAKKENKLVLISIGYSSCHWCHVMEHETFTDTVAANYMNEHFICIKVDREERPDIDQIYMTAVQMMTGSGGWPLNCFTLHDGRPIYGGTYFPKAAWMQVLNQLDSFYKNSPVKAETYAAELTNGIQRSEVVSIDSGKGKTQEDLLKHSVAAWKNTVDNKDGGPNRAPKFPLPGNYQFLLRYSVTENDNELFEHVKLTLNKMSYGGIYDHLAGGFARYSTDMLWKVPHFEKMLYDNAQLVTLYSDAYKVTKDPLYKKIAVETINFLEREMSDGNGGYYSAIDADSEGEEGKYYVWTKNELDTITLPAAGNNSHSLLYDYYNVNDIGYWENKNYILLRKKSDKEIAEQNKISVGELQSFISKANSILYKEREKRIRPALDKKIITSWNALQITALCNSFKAFGEEKYKRMAIECADGIMKNAMRNGLLLHVRNQTRVDQGYLEDYAFTITAFINLFQITMDEKWLLQAKKFADETISHYYDEADGFFYFTSSTGHSLIARKKEISDNVIPASNSEMANALFLLGDYFANEEYTSKAVRMLNAIEENISRYPSSHSNWMNLFMNATMPFSEIVVSGPNAQELLKKLSSLYLPNSISAGSTTNSSLPLLESRFVEDKTLIYICKNRTCYLPVEKLTDAIGLIKKESPFLNENVDYSE